MVVGHEIAAADDDVIESQCLRGALIHADGAMLAEVNDFRFGKLYLGRDLQDHLSHPEFRAEFSGQENEILADARPD